MVWRFLCLESVRRDLLRHTCDHGASVSASDALALQGFEQERNVNTWTLVSAAVRGCRVKAG